MEQNNIRNLPDYGILESYAQEEAKYHNMDDFRKNHIYEIARNNPAVWKVAKEDFELYKHW